jgi:hypothetical protein
MHFTQVVGGGINQKDPGLIATIVVRPKAPRICNAGHDPRGFINLIVVENAPAKPQCKRMISECKLGPAGKENNQA